MTSWLKEPLQTERLCLRPTRPGDEEWMIRLRTDPEVRKYLGGAIGEAAARESIQLAGELWGHFAILEKQSDCVVGSLSFARKSGPWEISYQLLQDFWERGLAGEAIEAALHWFFDATDENEVSAVTQTANIRSCRLLERLGARLAETLTYRDFPVRRYVFSRSMMK